MRSIKAILGDRETIVVARSASVADAARLMAAHHIGALPVLDSERLVGIFTERDVLTRIVAAGRDPDTTTGRRRHVDGSGGRATSTRATRRA